MTTIDLATKKSLILKQACFSKFNDTETEVLAGILTEKKFKAGETIVNEGERVDSVYLIVEGTVDIQHITLNPDKTQTTQSLAQLGAGAAIGLSETGFYSLTGKRTATVIALTDVTLLRLSVAAFNGFALSYSRVGQVMREYASNILSGRSME